MRNIFLLSLLFGATIATASEDLASKVDQLQKEVNELRLLLQQQQQDIDEGYPILERAETKSILDKINLSPELYLRVDKLNYTTGKIGPNGDKTLINDSSNPFNGMPRRDRFTKKFDPSGYARFRLNLHASFDDVEFVGRLVYANSSQSNQRLCILSRDIKSATANSAFDVDRAYVNYTPNKKDGGSYTFSFGVLPTTGGTPTHFSQHHQRTSMFPSLVFDMNTYGMIATKKFFQDSYVRAIIAKAYTLRPNFYPYQCNRENIDNANVYGIYADTRLKFMGDALLSYGVNVLHQLKAHPYLGPDVTADNSHNLGTMIIYGVGIDIEKFVQTHTTLFLHTAFSSPYRNGSEDDYKIIPPNTSGFTEEDYATGTLLQHSGYSLYFGGKYEINPEFDIGAEFNYGSKYWFAATQGSEDIFNKLATRGYAAQTYITWQFYKYLNAKLNYLRIHEAYTGSGWHFGEPATKDADQDIYSFILEAKF